jgi:NADH:ubiquinone oxidoreductase subunit E
MVGVDEGKLAELKSYIESHRDIEHPDSYLIAILHKAQELFGYLENSVMDFVAHEMDIPTAHIWGVATFYHYFNLHPVGKHIISVCLGTACYVNGANAVLQAIREELGIDIGETTGDKMFTLHEARCLGACGLAPVVMIDQKIHGGLTPEKTKALLKEYRSKG